MAGVRIHEHEDGGDGLPRVCMRCGAPATRDVPASFSWLPPWTYLLLFCGLVPLLLVLLLARKSSSILVPVCDRHANHWRYRQLFVGGGVLGAVVLFLGLAPQAKTLDADTFNAAATAAGAAVVVWLVTAVVLQHLAIRATRITDKWTDLANVSPDFVAALQRNRDAARSVPTTGARQQPP